MRSVLCLLLLAVVLPATAQSYDFVAAGNNIACGIGTPIVTPVLEWYPGIVEEPTDIRTIAPLGAGRLIAATHGTGINLVTIEADRATRTPFFSTTLYMPNELVADASGNVYVLVDAIPSLLLAVDADGTLRDTFTLPHRANNIELAADQCTLFYSHGNILTLGAVSRYDVCTATPLPDFVALPAGDYAHTQILPNTDILLVRGNFSGKALQRYSAGGTLLSTIPFPAALQPGATALSANGARILIADGCTGNVDEYDITTGALIRQVHLESITAVDSLVSGRGFTAAIGALAATAIPTASFAGLISLTALALLVALWRLSA
jgi:hypothetical protein